MNSGDPCGLFGREENRERLGQRWGGIRKEGVTDAEEGRRTTWIVDDDNGNGRRERMGSERQPRLQHVGGLQRLSSAREVKKGGGFHQRSGCACVVPDQIVEFEINRPVGILLLADQGLSVLGL